MPICPKCGQGNPEIARFCFVCARPLAAVPAQREERKVVTVVFADLVGFTSRADGMDPEDVQALLSPYHARLRAELERFGGTVEKFIGDAVMALFGAPVSREGDPERAVRAALAIRDWVRGEEEELQLRIAVNTGEALGAALADVRSAHSARRGTLIAGPGQGKSRLVHEFRRRTDEAAWLEGRCGPYGTGVTFWALGQLVKAHAGILEGESAATAAEKLEGAVREALRDDPEAQWVEGHLRTLVGLASESGSWHDRRSEAFFAWRRFLEGLAAVRPVVLVFEDLHWADDSLLDFIDHVLEWASDAPLLLVCTARPELLEKRPGWCANRLNSSRLRLSALRDEDVEQIVSALLGSALLSAETQAALLERAGGNPLYAEQYTRLFLERGRVEELQPVTLQGLIAARLDALPLVDKELLQAAAVIGRVFWRGSVSAVAGRDSWSVEERLRVLEHRELVRQSRASSLSGDSEWAFGHALVRDVAYGQIPRADRAEMHRITGESIESLGRPEDDGEMVAHDS